MNDFLKATHRISQQFRIGPGKSFKLSRIDPADMRPFNRDDREKSASILAAGVEALADLQQRLYAHDRWSVLLVFQAMDAAGKDGAIKHVMSGVNPQGCQVYSFKAPSPEELDHNFLWRCSKSLPERGRIGIFNRSYYEEVLIVRVHRELLHRQKLPKERLNADIWDERYEDIRDFERHLHRNGTIVVKFFLHVSKDEQRRRLLSRLDDPGKNWKFDIADLKERSHWAAYMDAYEQMVRRTATPDAPWYVVPADHKWFARLVVAAAVVSELDSLNLSYPAPTPRQRRELTEARRRLRR